MKLSLANSLVAGAARLSKFLKYYAWFFTTKPNEIVGTEYLNYGWGTDNLSVENVKIPTVDTNTIFRSDYDMDLWGVTIVDFVGTATMAISGFDFIFSVGGEVDNFTLSNGDKYWCREQNGIKLYSSGKPINLFTRVEGNGTISPISGNYNPDYVVTITATPINSELDKIELLSDSMEITNNTSIDAVMNSNKSATASFINSKFLQFTSDANTIPQVTSSDFDFSGGKPFSICGWFNVDGMNTNDKMPIFYRGTNSVLVYSATVVKSGATTATLEMRMYSPSFTYGIVIGFSLLLNKGWNFATVTFSGGYLASGFKGYSNNLLMTITVSQDNLTEMNQTVQPNRIGKYYSSAGSGLVDDVMVINKALSQAEVTELYIHNYNGSITSLSFYANIISYWGFDGTLNDGKGSNNLSCTSPIYNDGLKKAYLSNAGNDGTAVLNNNTLKFVTLNNALLALITAKSRYSRLYLEDGDYTAPLDVNLSINNLSIIGITIPVIDNATTPTKLINGTIIKGRLIQLSAINFYLYNIGIDVGSQYCTDNALSSGIDGLVIYSGSSQLLPTSCNHFIYNVISLCKNPSILFHAAIFEYVYNMDINNLTTYYATHGIVFKAENVTGKNLNSLGNNGDGIIIKKDNVINVKNISIDGFTYNQLSGSIPFAQIIIQNSQSDYVDNVTILNSNLVEGLVKHSVTGNTSNILIKDTNNNILYP